MDEEFTPEYLRYVANNAEIARTECDRLNHIVIGHNEEFEIVRNDVDTRLNYYANTTNTLCDEITSIKQTFTADLAMAIVNLVKKHYCFETTPEHDSQFYQELEQLYTFN